MPRLHPDQDPRPSGSRHPSRVITNPKLHAVAGDGSEIRLYHKLSFGSLSPLFTRLQASLVVQDFFHQQSYGKFIIFFQYILCIKFDPPNKISDF